jgi:hypothetical protein
MSLCFYCGDDGSRLKIPDGYEAAKVACPGCGSEYTLRREWVAPLNCGAGQHCQDMQECMGWCKPLIVAPPP